MAPEKPAALKTDDDGNCITICRTGQLEYISRLIHEENLTQREACQTFVDAIKKHTRDGDPITGDLTVEKVRSQYRRDAQQLKDKPKSAWVEPTQMTDEELEAEIDGKSEQLDSVRGRYYDVQHELNRRSAKRKREKFAEEYRTHIPDWDEITPDDRVRVARDLQFWENRIKGYLEMTEDERCSAQKEWQQESAQRARESQERFDRAWRAWAEGLGIKEDEVEASPAMVDFISKAFELVPTDQRRAVARDVYHVVAKRIHPDMGGDNGDMQTLTALYEELDCALA